MKILGFQITSAEVITACVIVIVIAASLATRLGDRDHPKYQVRAVCSKCGVAIVEADLPIIVRSNRVEHFVCP